MNSDAKITIPYPPWLRLKEATMLFGVGHRVIYKWRAEGIIKTCDTSGSGKNVVYRACDIDRALNQMAEGRIPTRHKEFFGKSR